MTPAPRDQFREAHFGSRPGVAVLEPAEEVASDEQQKSNQQRLERVGADHQYGDMGVAYQKQECQENGDDEHRARRRVSQ